MLEKVEGDQVTCVWQHGSDFKRETFDIAILEIWREPQLVQEDYDPFVQYWQAVPAAQ